LPIGESESGYTLVELLVVLTVISLLIAASPAIVSAARPGAEARAAAYALANEMRTARAAAIVADADRVLVLDLARKIYSVTPGGRERRLPNGLGMEFAGPEGARVEDRAEIRFFADGSSSGGAVRMVSRGQAHVVVDHGLTGRVSVDE